MRHGWGGNVKKQIVPIILFLAILCAGCTGNMETTLKQEETTVTMEVPPTDVEVQVDVEEKETNLEPEQPLVDTEKKTTNPEPELPSVDVVEEIAEPEPQLPLDDAVICIDPGHGLSPRIGQGDMVLVSPLSDALKPAYSTGTSSPTYTEEQLNLAVGLRLRDKLQSFGATVVMTRETAEATLEGIERCEIAHQSGADVAVHIHADGFSDASARGVSVQVPTGNLLGTPSIVEESARLGQLMVDAVCSETGAYNRGTVSRSDLTGFNFSKIPTVFIELGFMTNPEEAALLETGEYQDEIVDGIAQSLCSWYGIASE